MRPAGWLGAALAMAALAAVAPTQETFGPASPAGYPSSAGYPSLGPQGGGTGEAVAASFHDTLLNDTLLNYVDVTAAAVLLVFCVLGLFKGLIWQLSRIASLVAAYFAAGLWGEDLAGLLAPMIRDKDAAPPLDPASLDHGAPARSGDMVGGAALTSDLPLYLAYVLLFVASLVILSLLTLLVQRLVDKAGMTFYDRLGGGLLGAASGAAVMLAVLAGLGMFLPGDSAIVREAQASRSMRYGREVVSAVDQVLPLPRPVHRLFGAPGSGANGAGSPINQRPGNQRPGQQGTGQQGAGAQGARLDRGESSRGTPQGGANGGAKSLDEVLDWEAEGNPPRQDPGRGNRRRGNSVPNLGSGGR